MNIVGVLVGLGISWLLRSTSIAMMYVLVPGLLWFYSSSYKRLFVLGNVVIAALVALIPILVGVATMRYTQLHEPYMTNAMAVLQTQLTLRLSVYALLCFVVTWMIEVLKDVRSVEGDRELECHTLPVRLGIKTTQIIVIVVAFVSMVVIFVLRYLFL